MSLGMVSGSCDLVGSETVSFFCEKGFDAVGIDNNMSKVFFARDGEHYLVDERVSPGHKNFFA